jgi:hypothetical protein
LRSIPTLALINVDLQNAFIEGMIAKGSFTAALHKDLKIEPADIVLENRAMALFTAPTWRSSCARAASTP